MKSRYTSNAFQARVIGIIHEQHVPHDISSGSSHDDSYIQVGRTLQPYYATPTPDNAGPWLYGMIECDVLSYSQYSRSCQQPKWRH
jgi:hypothetical protein